MKLLWLCNTLIPMAAEQLNIVISKPESWITGLYCSFKNTNTELIYLFPSKKQKIEVFLENTTFLSYSQKNPLKFEHKQIVEFEEILKKTKPDVIHIFGTEYPHSYALVKAAENLGLADKVVISIQGMVGIYSTHYLAFMKEKFSHRFSLRDVLKFENIHRQMLDFKKRGEYEVKTIELAKNIIGRTDWDEACTKRINPDIKYLFCNETLRNSFYENEWALQNCEKHSIFVSQCSYPIKGFHLMLEAMTDIVKKYPDAKLYTTGKNPLNLSFKQKLRQSYYSKYIGKLIKKYHLENNVEFLGFLDEERMCKQYLNSHVFVCCSSVENSPNSLGEAMILGVPSVSSDVGGVKNLMEHGKEGFVYQADAPYMLSFYIQKIFENDNLALKFSKNARLHASKTHNSQENFDRLMEIYKEVFE